MINPLLERFDPARRPLLFLSSLAYCALLETGSGPIVQIWQGGLRPDQQFARLC